MKNISIKTVILYIWLVFSIIFVIWSAYNYFQISVMQKAYIAGQNDTIVSVIQRAQNKDCKPFNVYAGNDKVDLINVACLQQEAPQPTK